MRVGICILPEDRWPVAAEKWRRAEELGFAHAWTYDHLNWRDLRDGPWFAAMPTLTAAATVTSTIRLGTLVASPNFRHPVSFAREIITLDDVSAGRFTLGVGSGGVGWDATILGQHAWSGSERSGRFVEFVTLLDRLLSEREVDAAGEFYAANEARTHPGCVQQPRVPFAIAANGPNAMALAVRLGQTWVTTGAGDLAVQMEALDAECERQGRDPKTIDRLALLGFELDDGLTSPSHFDDVKGAYESKGVTDIVIHWPRASDPFRGDPSILERIGVV